MDITFAKPRELAVAILSTGKVACPSNFPAELSDQVVDVWAAMIAECGVREPVQIWEEAVRMLGTRCQLDRQVVLADVVDMVFEVKARWRAHPFKRMVLEEITEIRKEVKYGRLGLQYERPQIRARRGLSLEQINYLRTGLGVAPLTPQIASQ